MTILENRNFLNNSSYYYVVFTLSITEVVFFFWTIAYQLNWPFSQIHPAHLSLSVSLLAVAEARFLTVLQGLGPIPSSKPGVESVRSYWPAAASPSQLLRHEKD